MENISETQPFLYLSTDRNHFQADITRPLVEHLGQVLKKKNPARGVSEAMR